MSAAGDAAARLEEAALDAIQVCFVVDDVETEARRCEAHFGWGPFRGFTAPNADDGTVTQVSLGMAGVVQIELIRVLEGMNTVGAYQAEYGRGPQHLGVACSSLEAGIEGLSAIGGACGETGGGYGVRFGFVDTPAGRGLLELLDIEGPRPRPSKQPPEDSSLQLEVDRATLVCSDIDQACTFFGQAFRWGGGAAEEATLVLQDAAGGERDRLTLRRRVARSGLLELELVEARDPVAPGPYSAQRARGAHGLAHASALVPDLAEALRVPGIDAAIRGRWLETGEYFALCNGPAGPATLQLRSPG